MIYYSLCACVCVGMCVCVCVPHTKKIERVMVLLIQRYDTLQRMRVCMCGYVRVCAPVCMIVISP